MRRPVHRMQTNASECGTPRFRRVVSSPLCPAYASLPHTRRAALELRTVTQHFYVSSSSHTFTPKKTKNPVQSSSPRGGPRILCVYCLSGLLEGPQWAAFREKARKDVGGGKHSAESADSLFGQKPCLDTRVLSTFHWVDGAYSRREYSVLFWSFSRAVILA